MCQKKDVVRCCSDYIALGFQLVVVHGIVCAAKFKHDHSLKAVISFICPELVLVLQTI